MNPKYLATLFISIIFFGCVYSQSNEFERLDVKDFKSQIQADSIYLIDVRTPEEYQEGHIKEAINYNYYDEEFLQQFEPISKHEAIYLYCGSGIRSEHAAKQLIQKGYKEVYDLKGGIKAWNKSLEE
jgi:rhodanese-related sulfurtransferase